MCVSFQYVFSVKLSSRGRNHSICSIVNPAVVCFFFFFSLDIILYAFDHVGGRGPPMRAFSGVIIQVHMPLTQGTRFKEPGF